MKLNNRFDNADKMRMWMDTPWCAICKSNQGCSAHHIEGCKQNCHKSLLNSIMLCIRCHKLADTINAGGSTGEHQRKDMRSKALILFEKNNLTWHDYDIEFHSKYNTSPGE